LKKDEQLTAAELSENIESCVSCLAFALHTFSLMVYFAVLSTVDLTVTHQRIFPLTPIERPQLGTLQSAMLMLQVYITVVRRKLYFFFLKIFLFNFLSGVDDQQLQRKLQGTLLLWKQKRRINREYS